MKLINKSILSIVITVITCLCFVSTNTYAFSHSSVHSSTHISSHFISQRTVHNEAPALSQENSTKPSKEDEEAVHKFGIGMIIFVALLLIGSVITICYFVSIE